MTDLMRGLLERVLSEELGRQAAWLQQDEENLIFIGNRENVMQEIKDFMKENDIRFRDDFYINAYYRETLPLV